MQPRQWVIEITGPRYSANDRLHWRRAQALKVAWRDAAQLLTRAAVGGVPPRLERAHILVEQVPGSRRRTDPGNVAPAAKAAVDGLVLAGMLVDDDAAHLDGPDFRLAEVVARHPRRGLWTLRLTITELIGEIAR